MNNIIKRVWNQNRLVNIEDLTGMVFQAEAGGHTFEISGVDDEGNAVALSGTVSGVFRRPDNADIALTGSASDGVVSVTLSEDCYAVPGRFGLTVFVTSNSQKVAVYACVGTVAVSSTGNVAGDTPASVEDLIDDINAAIAALNAAIGSIPADYSQFMAAIAPAYSSSALYAVGSYAWYNGSLYRCITAITTAEAWTAAHWTAAVLGDDVGDLKNAFINNYSEFNFDIVANSYVETNGAITAYNGWSRTDYIPCSDVSVIYVNNGLTQGSVYNHFYDANKNPIGTNFSILPDFNTISIPDNAAYVIFSNYSATVNTYKVYKPVSDATLTKKGASADAYSVGQAINSASASNYFERLYSKNRFNKEEVVNGYLSTTGGIISDQDWRTSNYCYVKGASKIVASYLANGYRQSHPLYFACAYDENKAFLRYYGIEPTSPLTVESDVWYVRFSTHMSNFDTGKMMLETGETITSYTDYWMHDVPQYSRPKWLSKKWCCVGDSLTEINDRTDKHYYDYVSDLTGISVQILGVSGTGYASGSASNTAFYQRVANADLDCDVVTVFGSGNDLSAGAPLGEVTDNDTTTICGCINTTIDNLITRFTSNNIVPQIGIVTPTPWVNQMPYNNGDMEAYATAIVNICKRRSIACLDLYHCSNLNPNSAEYRTLAYSKDEGNGVHPDETGHKIIASRFLGFLDSLLA